MKRYVLSVKVLLVLLLSLNVGYAAKQVVTNNESPVRFAIIGDRAGQIMPGIYDEIVKEVERVKPDFVITVGDMIEGDNKDNEWKEYKKIISPLSMPIYFTPGNHDIRDDTTCRIYENQIGKPYYSFDYKNLHFIFLDNSRWESTVELPKEQIDWLTKDLQEHQKADYTFAFFHKPLWIETIFNGKTDTLHSLFRNYGVDAVFNGHLHSYFSGKLDNILYTIVGSSGGACAPGPTGLEYHFTWVTVDKNGISIAPVKIGSVLPWEEVTIKEGIFMDTIAVAGLTFRNSLSASENVPISDTIIVKLTNLSPDCVLEDTLQWKIPEGWSVTPKSLLVKISAKDSSILKFSIKNKSKKLYPVPQASINFPYAKGKKYGVTKPLSITRKAYANRAKTSPVMDAKLSESIWRKPASLLFSADGNPMKIDSTYFYFSYDDSNLYVAAHCKESQMDSIFATAVKQDDAVYAEDCIGFFLCPDPSKGIVYQIYFNPLGTAFDQKISTDNNGGIKGIDRNWNGNYEVKATKGNNFWVVEARIPLNQFEVSGKNGQEWRLNFRRKQKRMDNAGDWQVPISYDPNTYGILIMK
ncbi:MAG: metallophosphoesterase [bacterium]